MPSKYTFNFTSHENTVKVLSRVSNSLHLTAKHFRILEQHFKETFCYISLILPLLGKISKRDFLSLWLLFLGITTK